MSTQVIDCRRILKWTYAEGYYKFTKEDGKKEDLAAEQHERFFVFNQVSCCDTRVGSLLPTPRAEVSGACG